MYIKNSDLEIVSAFKNVLIKYKHNSLNNSLLFRLKNVNERKQQQHHNSNNNTNNNNRIKALVPCALVTVWMEKPHKYTQPHDTLSHGMRGRGWGGRGVEGVCAPLKKNTQLPGTIFSCSLKLFCHCSPNP